MANRFATLTPLPLGRIAQGWLSGLMPFRRQASPVASRIVTKLYREHHAAIPYADDAVAEVHAALAAAGALDEYEAWRAKNPATVSGWPTREAAERRRRSPAV